LKINLTIDEIKIFLEVVNAGSITGASKNLFISQPAISQYIKNMEEKLDFKLFERSKSEGLTLTERGFKVYKTFIPLVKIFDETMYSLSNIDDLSQEPIKIGSSKIIGDYLLPKIIAEFVKTKGHSNFCVEIQNTSETIEKILDERIAFGLIETPFYHNLIDTEIFCTDEMKLICHPESEIARKKHVSIEEMKDIPFIFREIGSGTRKVIEEEFSKYDFSPKIHLSFSSNEAIKRAIMNGLGFSILSEIAVENEEKLGMLSLVKITGMNFKREFYLSKKKGKLLSDRENELLEFLKQWAKDHSNH